MRKIRKQLDGPPEVEWYTADTLMDECGLIPDQYLDLQALMGDSGDGVKGAEGIGKKIGLELIQKHGSLAAVVDNVWSLGLSDKKRNAIIEFAKRFDDHVRLVKLRTDVPIAG